MDSIAFDASVYKVQTLSDNGIRVTLDLAEGSIEALAKLAACQQSGAYLSIVATPFVRGNLTELDHETKKTAEDSAAKVGSGRSIKQRDQRAGGGV